MVLSMAGLHMVPVWQLYVVTCTGQVQDLAAFQQRCSFFASVVSGTSMLFILNAVVLTGGKPHAWDAHQQAIWQRRYHCHNG